MKKKQSSIEWLIEQLKERYSLMNSEPLFDQAKAMHKEEIVEAYGHGSNNGYMYRDGGANLLDSEQYYNITYGGKTD